MKKDGWTDLVTCPEDDCEEQIQVAYYPGNKGRTYGPPEDCCPPDPDDIDTPDECPVCGYEITDRDRDRWCDELREERRDRGDRY